MDREIAPDRGPYEFSGVYLDKKVARGLVFTWYAETNITNIVKMTFLVIGFSWPPIRWSSYFLDKDKE